MHLECADEMTEQNESLDQDYSKTKEKLSETNLESLTAATSGIPLKKLNKVNMAVPQQPQLKLMNQHSYYTRHPHYPDVKLNTKMPQMTTSTMSQSNLSSNNDGGGNRWLRDLSDTNSAIDEPLNHFQPQQLPSPTLFSKMAVPDSDYFPET